MANTKISDLTADTTPTNDDLAVTVDSGSGANKKVTLANLGKGLNSGVIPNTPAGSVAATNVQAAINELDTDKAPLNSPSLVTPDLGTPSAGTLTSCTGLPISTGVSGLGANVATFLATPSSANLASALTDETGSGAAVFANSPTLVTPALGTPASGNLSNCTAYEGTAIASTGEAGGTKFLREDGDGTCSWQEAGGGGAFATAANVTSNSPGTLATDDFVFGSSQLTDDGNADHDSRFIFDKSKNSFAAGSASSTQWDGQGNYSAIFGKDCGASGSGSFVAGYLSYANGSNSACFGRSSYANGESTFAAGWGVKATEKYSQAFGLNIEQKNNTQMCFLSGYKTFGLNPGVFARANGQFDEGGDAQYQFLVLRASTTDATQTNMFYNSESSATLTYIKLGWLSYNQGYAWNYNIDVVAFQKDGAAGSNGDSWAYNIKGLIVCDSTNTTTLKGQTITTIYEDDATFDVTTAADNTHNGLEIKVTGAADKNVRWVATVHMTQVIYD